jgi:hypothetical protein
MDAKLMWIWLAQACGQGSRTAIHLLCAYGSPEKIYRADRKSLAKKLGERELSLLNRLSNKDLSDATSILRRCKDTGVGILTPDDSQYPRTLYQLRDAPIVLYYVGKLPDFESFCCCAVVGTRTMSEYGKRISYDIGRGLGAGGAVLVSGLALGVDGMAACGALSASDHPIRELPEILAGLTDGDTSAFRGAADGGIVLRGRFVTKEGKTLYMLANKSRTDAVIPYAGTADAEIWNPSDGTVKVLAAGEDLTVPAMRALFVIQ